MVHREGRWYVADCPEVGTISQGKTVEEAIANLREATELMLEARPLAKQPRAILTTFEILHA